MAFVTIHYRQPGRLGRIHLAAWAIALVVLTKYLELAWLVLAGVVGGVVSWFLSRYIIVNPVVGYQNNEEGGGDVSVTALTTPLLKWRTEWYVCIGVPLFLLIFLIGASFFVGWSSRSQRVNDEDREWWARLGAWVIISILAWVVSCALVIFVRLRSCRFQPSWRLWAACPASSRSLSGAAQNHRRRARTRRNAAGQLR